MRSQDLQSLAAHLLFIALACKCDGFLGAAQIDDKRIFLFRKDDHFILLFDVFNELRAVAQYITAGIPAWLLGRKTNRSIWLQQV